MDVEGFEAAVFKGGSNLLGADKSKSPLVVFEFCGWAEKRAHGIEVGDSQRILRQFGYDIWKLEDFIAEKKPTEQILTQGFATLIGVKH